MTIIVIVLVLVLLAGWIISTQRRLVVMDENVNNAMSQIGVQLSSRFDALTALLDLAKGYAAHESQTLIETIKSRRSVITAKSTPEDVLKQEGVISEALGRISMVAERYPELKADKGYAKCMDAVDSYEKMVRTSRLIYNDSVTKLNRELRLFPTSLVQTYERNEKFFLQVVNDCRKAVRFEDGIPVTDRPGHGIGVSSICAIVERYGGLYSFSVKEGKFVLRVSL